MVFAPGRARIPSCLFSQNLQEPGISGCLWTAKPREPLRSRVPWPHSHPVWGQNTAKHQCPCPLQPQALVSRGGKCARGTRGMFHRVPQHVSPPRLLSPKCIWKYQLLCQTRDKSELMDSKPGKGNPGIHACAQQNHVDFFFFSLKTRLKARLLIRQPFRREKAAMGCLSRESESRGLYGVLVPCLHLGESSSQTSERSVVHKGRWPECLRGGRRDLPAVSW